MNINERHYKIGQEVYSASETSKKGLEPTRIAQLFFGFLGTLTIALSLTLSFTLDGHHITELKEIIISEKFKIIAGAAFGFIVGGAGYYYAYRKNLEEQQNMMIRGHGTLQIEACPSEREYIQKRGIQLGFPDLDEKIKKGLIEKLKRFYPDSNFETYSVRDLRTKLSSFYKDNKIARLPDIENEILQFLMEKYTELIHHNPKKSSTVKSLRKVLYNVLTTKKQSVSPNYEIEIKEFLKKWILAFCSRYGIQPKDIDQLSEQDLKETLLDLYLDFGSTATRFAEADINKPLRRELRELCIKENISYANFEAHKMSEKQLKEAIFEIYTKGLIKTPVEKMGWIGFWVSLALVVIAALIITLCPPASNFVKEAIGLPGLIAFFSVTSLMLLCYSFYRTYNTLKTIAHYEDKPEPVRPLALTINLSLIALFVLSILGIRYLDSEIFNLKVLAGFSIAVGASALFYSLGRHTFSKQVNTTAQSFLPTFIFFASFISLGQFALLGGLNLHQLGWGIMGVYLSFVGLGLIYRTYKVIKNRKEPKPQDISVEPQIKKEIQVSQDQFELYLKNLTEGWNHFTSYLENMMARTS